MCANSEVMGFESIIIGIRDIGVSISAILVRSMNFLEQTIKQLKFSN
jgi:hypothetical protein